MDTRILGRVLAGWVAWLETMHTPEGYGGPVAHWWQNCLPYTGVGLDWRYEGIISGFLNLFRCSGDPSWLARARRAGDELLRGQLPDGRFRHSSFELNPYPGGTPHEAACDLALLRLARVLRECDQPDWSKYLDAAQRNLLDVQLGVLWDHRRRLYRDHPRIPCFVPNKAATFAEALCLLDELIGDWMRIDRYVLVTLEAVLAHQVRGGALDGAIHQYSQRGSMVPAFYPFYVARCVPALVAGYKQTGDEPLIDAALRAMRFVLRWQYDDGSFPQAVYASGRVNRYPQWVAGVGDILRALRLLEPYGLQADRAAAEAWLLGGAQTHGGMRTARGFAAQVSQRGPDKLPEFRDLLPVAGWGDKAFCYLTEVLLDGQDAALLAREPPVAPLYEEVCQFRGMPCLYREDGSVIELWHGDDLWYRWRKGSCWAEVCPPERFWK